MLYLLQGKFTKERNLPAKIISLDPPHYCFGEQYLRRMLRLRDRSGLLDSAVKHRLSVLLPLRTVGFKTANVKTIGWIPDFQHVLLPEFFSEESRRYQGQRFSIVGRAMQSS